MMFQIVRNFPNFHVWLPCQVNTFNFWFSASNVVFTPVQSDRGQDSDRGELKKSHGHQEIVDPGCGRGPAKEVSTKIGCIQVETCWNPWRLGGDLDLAFYETLMMIISPTIFLGWNHRESCQHMSTKSPEFVDRGAPISHSERSGRVTTASDRFGAVVHTPNKKMLRVSRGAMWWKEVSDNQCKSERRPDSLPDSFWTVKSTETHRRIAKRRVC